MSKTRSDSDPAMEMSLRAERLEHEVSDAVRMLNFAIGLLHIVEEFTTFGRRISRQFFSQSHS